MLSLRWRGQRGRGRASRSAARTTRDGGWYSSLEPEDLKAQVRENLAHLGLDALDAVNLRLPAGRNGHESVAGPPDALAELDAARS
jgi:hypothetical protein